MSSKYVIGLNPMWMSGFELVGHDFIELTMPKLVISSQIMAYYAFLGGKDNFNQLFRFDVFKLLT